MTWGRYELYWWLLFTLNAVLIGVLGGPFLCGAFTWGGVFGAVMMGRIVRRRITMLGMLAADVGSLPDAIASKRHRPDRSETRH
jgi:hypothetical protein